MHTRGRDMHVQSARMQPRAPRFLLQHPGPCSCYSHTHPYCCPTIMLAVLGACMHLPFRAMHVSPTVLSSLPLASLEPSAFHAILLTHPL